MKRQHCRTVSNGLMCLGLLTMVLGLGYSIINQLPSVNLPQFFAHGAMFSIFVSALLWLVGAGGRGWKTAIFGYVTTATNAAVAITAHRTNRLQPLPPAASDNIQRGYVRRL